MRSQKYQRIKLYYLHFISDICMIYLRLMYRRLYYYVDQFNGRSTVWWWFKYWYFVRWILKLLLVVEVDWLLLTCKMVYTLLLSMLTEFLISAKTIGCQKVSKKIKYYDLCTRLNVGRKYQEKTSSLNLKLV